MTGAARFENTEPVYDLMVIGAGFAGMAAALFAARAGLSVAQAGATGGIDFSTGFIDLMGVHPMETGERWDDPLAAVRAVVRDVPEHPYSRLTEGEIQEALRIFTDFLAEQGLEYIGRPGLNTDTPTPAGTLKRTFLLPRSAWNGAEAFRKGAPTLIVDFHGLKGFSGRQMVETLGPRWPGLRTARLDFPLGGGELYPEHMAWTLGDPAHLDKLGRDAARLADGAEYIGFPAVLGLNNPMRMVARLEELTGAKVFEIPTLPPSIAGTRLRAAFDRGLPPLGVSSYSQKLVTRAEVLDDGTFRFQVGQSVPPVMVRARRAILAGGRFFGKGLKALRDRVVEPLFDLPVALAGNREDWHRKRFLDSRGHPVNLAGLEIDHRMRPVDGSGRPAHQDLYAAGAILAHQDWMRMKCGAGLAVATAYKAVACMTNSE